MTHTTGMTHFQAVYYSVGNDAAAVLSGTTQHNTTQQTLADNLFCNFLKGINSISRKEFSDCCVLYI